MSHKNQNTTDTSKQVVVMDYSTLEFMLNDTIEKAVKGINDVINLKPIKESFEEIDLMDMKQTITVLKVSKMTIHNWKKKGLIKSYKVGRKIYFKKSELLEAVKRQKYSI